MITAKIKDDKEAIINGNIWKVMLSILLPIFLYNMLNFGYQIFDTFIVSMSGVGSVGSIVILSEIKKAIATLGGGFITGAMVIIARRMGARRHIEANKLFNTLFYTIVILSVFTVGVLVPFAPTVLAILQTPTDVIQSSTGYFVVQLLVIVVELFNSMYIGMQKNKGKTKILFYLNIVVIAIKIGLSSWFIYGGFSGVNSTWLALATLAAQLFLFGFAITTLLNEKEVVHVKPKFFIGKEQFHTIFKLGFPIFIGNFVFHLAKVFINSQLASFYGTALVAVIGLACILTDVLEYFLAATSAAGKVLIGQNYGDKRDDRVVKAFNVTGILSAVATVVFVFVLSFFERQLSIFILGADQSNLEMMLTILHIFKWQLFGSMIIRVSEVLIEAIGKSKILMINDILRTVLTRIPFILLAYYVWNIGYESGAYLFIVSNAITGIFSMGMALYYISKLKYKHSRPKEELLVVHSEPLINDQKINES